MKNSKKIRLLLIGCGPHAKRIYLPLIEREKKLIEHTHIIDIQEKMEDILNFLSNKKINYSTYFISKDKMSYYKLHKDVETYLNNYVIKNNINAVIIATEPLTHMMYARWSLKKGITTLMDKPVSTYKNISNSVKLAKKTKTDYDLLAKLYLKSIKKFPKLSFSLQSQRRFHPAILKIKNLIKKVSEKTNCPVTSIQSYHCDGQWRLPTEIVNQLYHSYFQGYGKCSHSGYHFFDLVPYIMESGLSNSKYYDNIDVSSSFVYPLDVLSQFNLEDYKNIFGKNFEKFNQYDENEYSKLMQKYGEVDAYNTLSFKKDKKIITMATINLLHNGFSRRDWPTAKGRDLYKGNGRVRHESLIIQQGPFQSIQLHSYQSNEVKKKNNNLYGVGGEFHMDLFVFRNSKMIKGKTFEKIEFKNLNSEFLSGHSRGHQENARAKCFFEFIESVLGTRSRDRMKSDLLTHKVGAYIMSAAYESAAKQRTNSISSKVNISII